MKEKIDEENQRNKIKKLKYELLEIKKLCCVKFVPKEIEYLQTAILTIHAIISSYMDYIILNQIDEDLKMSTLKVISPGRAIYKENMPSVVFSKIIREPIEKLNFPSKAKLIRDFDKDFNIKLLRDFNNIRNDFAHPVTRRVEEKYDINESTGRNEIINACEKIKKVYEYFIEYGKGKNLRVRLVSDDIGLSRTFQNTPAPWGGDE